MTLASSGLHSVDQSVDPAARLRFLDAEGAKPAMRAAKLRSFEQLRLRTGASVLDVGCGSGDDARTLAETVGPAGKVVAIDVDPVMLAEAGRRSAAGLVEFRLCNVYELDYPDAAFDAARAERTFLHLAEPERALAQMARVVRPGGRVVVLDRDIETRTIDAGDRAVTRRILHFWCDRFLGGWIGRCLPRLFREASLLEVTVEPFTVVDTDFASFEVQYNLTRIVRQAEAAGAITADEVASWLADVKERAGRGSFFSSMTNFVVSGTR